MTQNTPRSGLGSGPRYRDWTGQPIENFPQNITPGASAFVLNDEGKLLLQKRSDNGHWCMPGGRMDPGESIAQTCVREVWEETGLHVKIIRLIGVYSDPRDFAIATYPDGNSNQLLSLSFECGIIGGELTLSHEGTELGFYSLESLPEPMLLTHKIRIEDALKELKKTIIR
jgi:8-oxo-dGTP pyrophosphatase MutT (NUDIX family)